MNQNLARNFGLALFALACSLVSLSAQVCPEGQTALTLDIHTDAFGYETYWAIVPNGYACADSVLWEGSNIEDVGCNGDGDVQGENGYDNNVIVTVDSLCATTGDSLHLVFIDSYGDGGLFFELFYDNILAGAYNGDGYGNDWLFVVGENGAPAYDSPCGAMDIEVDGDTLILNTIDCMAASGEPAPPTAPVYGCQINGSWCETGLSETAWLTFTAVEGNCEIQLCHDSTQFDTQVALWKASDCMDFSTYELIGANDDIAGGCGPGSYYASRMQTGCLEVGTTYLIQVDGWQGSDGQVAVSISPNETVPGVSASLAGLECAPEKGEEPNGVVVLNVSGTGSNYNVAWIGPDAFTSTDWAITGLGGGSYSALISTSCGEVLSYAVTIDVPTEMVGNLQFEGPECPGLQNGWASIETTGGVAPYTYTWSNAQGEFSTDMVVENLPAGDYTLAIEDDNGCDLSYTFMLDVQGSNFEFSLGSDTTICDDASIVISGPAGMNYDWSTGVVDQFIVIDGATLGAGTYSYVLTATNTSGCYYADAIFVTIFDCTIGVSNVAADAVLQVGPNPSRDVWNVELVNQSISTSSTWWLLDATGRRIDSGISNASTWNVSAAALAAGSYQLHVEQEDGSSVVLRLIRD